MRILVLAALLGLAACGTSGMSSPGSPGSPEYPGQQPSPVPLPANGPIAYTCSDGTQLTVDVEGSQARVAIIGGPSMVLPSSGAGAYIAMLSELLGHPDPRLDALGRQIVSETVLDFACAPPRRIIVVRPLNNDRSTFDILPFFLRDARFAALLSHYRVRSRTSFETYELTSPLPAPAAACRRGV